MVTTTRQGSEFIKTRDFHNLMGRVGRAGKYTEGTIIFTDHRIYDQKSSYHGRYVWRKAKQLLDFNNSEQCQSAILAVFDPVPEDEQKRRKWEVCVNKIKEEIKNYLLNSISNIASGQEFEEFVEELAKNTLAYFQADLEKKELLVSLFLELANEVREQEPSVERQRVFSKSVVSITETQEILNFLQENSGNLILSDNADDIFQLIWDVLYRYNNKFSYIDNDVLKQICSLWISGGKSLRCPYI